MIRYLTTAGGGRAVLLDAVIVSLILGWLLRGRLANLAEVEIRGVALALAAAVVQYGGQYAANAGWTLVQEWGPLFYAGTFLLLFAVIWLNRRNPALVLIGLGIFLNALVIAANGGKMPVSAESLLRAGLEVHIPPLESGSIITHQLLTEETRLRFLADIFYLPKPYPRPKVFSIGDVVLSAGAMWCIVGGMLAHPTVAARRRALEVRRVQTLS